MIAGNNVDWEGSWISFATRHGFPIHHAGLNLLVAGEKIVVLNAPVQFPALEY